MSRATTVVALVQLVLVVLCYFALGIVLKMSGYPSTLLVRWNPFAVFLREQGLWLLLLPVLWVFFATAAQRLDRGVFSSRFAYLLGVVLNGVIVLAFLYACLSPYTRPFTLLVR